MLVVLNKQGFMEYKYDFDEEIMLPCITIRRVAGMQTVVEYGCDSQGRRYFKKVTVAGTGNTFECTMKFVRAGRKREV